MIHLNDEQEEPFEWLYDQTTIHTPTTATSTFSHQDSDFEPPDDGDDIPTSSDTGQGNKELKEWLASTNYKGRWRSTDNYLALSRHGQKTFRNQMKDIFRHVLLYMASSVGDVVWNDIIDDEMQKPTTTNGGYDNL